MLRLVLASVSGFLAVSVAAPGSPALAARLADVAVRATVEAHTDATRSLQLLGTVTKVSGQRVYIRAANGSAPRALRTGTRIDVGDQLLVSRTGPEAFEFATAMGRIAHKGRYVSVGGGYFTSGGVVDFTFSLNWITATSTSEWSATFELRRIGSR